MLAKLAHTGIYLPTTAGSADSDAADAQKPIRPRRKRKVDYAEHVERACGTGDFLLMRRAHDLADTLEEVRSAASTRRQHEHL